MRVVRLLLQSMLHNEKTFLRFSVKKIQAQNFWWSLRTVLPWPIFSFTNFFLLYPTDPMHYYMSLVFSWQYKSQFHVGRVEEGSSWAFWLCFLSGFYAACALAWAYNNIRACQAKNELAGDWDSARSCCVHISSRRQVISVLCLLQVHLNLGYFCSFWLVSLVLNEWKIE